MKGTFTAMFLIGFCCCFCQSYNFPHESEEHEGSWLQWPHHHEYGMFYRNSLDLTWIAMTKALVVGEKVHIIAYDATEQSRITALLTGSGVSLTNIDFYQWPTNDVWVRDNGPVFVRDSLGNVLIEDWGFNGWGGKYAYNKCDTIPSAIAHNNAIPLVALNSIMTNEGGAIEVDGAGVLMACKSSVISQTPANSVRNPGMTQAQAENIFAQYLGVSKFIWLNGKTGDSLDVTDMHIDGFAKFLNDTAIVTMSNSDLTYWGLSASDISTLNTATNISGHAYTLLQLPLTANNVTTAYGNPLGYKGSYVNYYVANDVVLVPNYADPNDSLADALIQTMYPTKTIVGIDCRNLYENGGMVHCVTQQQILPKPVMPSPIADVPANENFYVLPNPAQGFARLHFKHCCTEGAAIQIFSAQGKCMHAQAVKLNTGTNEVRLETAGLPTGFYIVKMQSAEHTASCILILEK